MPASVWAIDFSSSRYDCTALYSLTEVSQQEFESQKQSLSSHLRRKKIQLINLNAWANSNNQPVKLSGREKNKLRRQYDISPKQDTILVFSKSGKVIADMRGKSDLVEVIFQCGYAPKK